MSKFIVLYVPYRAALSIKNYIVMGFLLIIVKKVEPIRSPLLKYILSLLLLAQSSSKSPQMIF